MKIIEITAAYKPAYVYGGPTMSVAKLCEALQSTSGIDLSVLTTTANGKDELNVIPNKQVIVDGVEVTYFHRLTKDHTHFSPALLFHLQKTIKENRNLIIHIHAWWNLVSIFGCLVAKWYKIPVILSPRGMLTEYTLGNRNAGFKNIIHNLLGKQLLRYCHIHATSEKEKQDVIQLITPKSVTVVPNLVSLPPLEQAVRGQEITKNENTFNLIFLSRVEEKKGIELLFDALTALSINWSLTIAGSGDENYIKSLKLKAERQGLDTHVKWLGHINNELKFKLLADHDLMVLTSHNENFANVVIESLRMGTPVLISDKVGLADYVQQKELGWITNLEVGQIRKTLQSAYENIELRNKIREKGPKLIVEDFNSDKLIKDYIKLYSEVLKNYGQL